MVNREPVYVAHRKWFFLLLGLWPILIALFGIFVFVSSIPNVQNPFDPTNLIFLLAIEFFLLLLAIYPVRVFFKSRRIEFYDDFVRISLSKKNFRDISYSALELGSLKMMMVKGGISFHFKISVIGEGNASSWDIYNGNVRILKTPIYAWLKTKIG